ncbi:MAG TPA: TetR/AcrR family transcriptional regulator [Geminicoccus sp.]|uniref:TetR/AcrR family transcriptional regulator n=1 Tax=Geminicoccus sp. TaxID=2024832 RepID=UPI002E2ED992|nr:TetR/AcrR family transcriptional regulator [Geminicoccus sp.]HEX2526048.1 TetR/AcrR family transcriptional regulator [Geminicoccus sp.]
MSVPPSSTSRLSKAERRQQLLDTARVIVREEGADRLTLGHLAARAGVSKPIVYEHFGTRPGLLIALYKAIDAGQAEAVREALLAAPRELDETATMLADAYMHCYADTSGEWHAVGAALSGSEEMGAVHQELLAIYVSLFVTALEPYSTLPARLLHLCCVGLVGAGEALSAAMVRGEATEKQAAEALAALMRGSVGTV